LSAETDPSEAWRLLFVAITRARQKLYLTHHEQDDSGRIVKPLELDFFDGKLSQVQPRRLNLKQPDPAWNSQLVKPTADLKTLLRERLANYQLNATALNSYTNLEYAGPEMFLLNNLLRFPSAKSASAEFGSAVHETLRQVYQHFLQRSAKMPILEVQKIFTNNLTARRLAKTDLDFYLKKGLDLLPIYLKWAKFSQHQIPEQNLSARLGLVNLTGKLDLLSVDRSTKTITVIDYKTGAPFDKFDSGTKFKTHGYKQQLMFYKLLIENSAAYSGFRVELGRLDFVEPIEGVIKSLELHYSDTEMAEFRHLVEIVWHNIQNLIFPDTSSYERNLRGSLKFEQDLLK
jgi:DNA helicase-2/ATP-dependent DNA helicase PcrA